MDFKPLFYTIFKSLNPYNYKTLVGQKFSQILKYYFFILFLTILLMFVLFIPTIYSTTNYVSRGIGHFDNLTLSSNFVLKDSFNALNAPLVRFENVNSTITNEFILITPETVSYKSYLFFGSQRDVILKHNTDLTTDDRAKMWLGLLFFFMLPSLLFWSIIFSIVYFTVIILLTLIVMLMISGVFRINIKIASLLKVCIYSSTIFILLQLLLMPFYRIFALPLAVYWLLILVILFVLKDNLDTSKRDVHGAHYTNNSSSSKNDSIFGSRRSSTSSISSSKNRIEERDSYDVDENGNIRGSSKKSKHISDDDDGYVELK